jgi:hypothetical protein
VYLPSILPSMRQFRGATVRNVAVVGGVGSGKTFALIDDCLDTMMGELGAYGPGLITAPSITYLKRVIWPHIHDVIRKCYRWKTNDGRYRPLRHGPKGDYWLTKDPVDFRLILFPTIEGARREVLLAIRDDAEKLAGFEVVGAWHDEITKSRNVRASVEQRAYNALKERVRLGPPALQRWRVAGSPDCGMGHWWVQHEYVPNQANPKWLLLHARTADNTFAQNAEMMQAIRETYATMPHMVKALLEGQFFDVVGDRIFSGFDPIANVKPWVYRPDLPLLFSFDFNVRPFSACSIWQTDIDPDRFTDAAGTLYGVGEYAIHNGTIEDVWAAIGRDYRDHRGPVAIYGDTNGSFLNPKNGKITIDWATTKTRADELWPGRWRPRWLTDRNPDLNPSITRTNLTFRTARNQRRIFINPAQTEMLKTVNQWVYDEHGKWRKWDHPLKHFGDTLRYLVEKVFPNPVPVNLRSLQGAVRVRSG